MLLTKKQTKHVTKDCMKKQKKKVIDDCVKLIVLFHLHNHL